MTPLSTALWILLGVALVISVVTDLATQRIFDVVTLPTLVVVLGLKLWKEGFGTVEEGFLSAVLCAAGAAVPFGIAALRGRMGWGDVKLMAAVGAVMGWPLVLYAVCCVSLAGALQAVVTLMWKGEVWGVLSGVLVRVGRRLHLLRQEAAASQARKIPYGVAIAAGTFWAMWWQYPADNIAR